MNNENLIFKDQKKENKSTPPGGETKGPEMKIEAKNINSEKESQDNLAIEVQNEGNIQITSNQNLTEELDKIKQQLLNERKESINKINELNKIDEENDKKIKLIYINFRELLEKLKKYDKSLLLMKPKLKTKIKLKKTEEKLKNDLKSKDVQIEFLKGKVNYDEENYPKMEQNFEKEKDKENKLNQLLLKLKSDIEKIEKPIEQLRIINNEHLNCERKNKLLKKKYSITETDYEYEKKKAKKLALIKFQERHEEDAVIEEEYDQLDEQAKAEKDAHVELPKIKIIKYRGEKIQKLEAEIIRRNKIYQIKSDVIGNATKLYKKIDNMYSDNNRYITKANSFIRINRKNVINYEDNYLFSENDTRIMKKAIPEKMFISCKNKYNDILQNKKELEKNLSRDYSAIKIENEFMDNKYEKCRIETKSIGIIKTKLLIKSQQLKSQINITKKKIKEIKEEINKEKKKIKEKEIEKKRISTIIQKIKNIKK